MGKAVLKSQYKGYVNGQPVETMALEMERDMIDMTCPIEPDPNWAFIDAAGHFHARSKKGTLPTLEMKREYVSCPDSAEGCCDGYDDTWLECVLCHEKIVPGTRPGQRSSISGPMHWRITVSGVYIEPGTRVNVRIDREGKPVMFGIAECTSLDVAPGDRYTADLIGIGELGYRG